MKQAEAEAVAVHHELEYSKAEVSALVIKAYVVSLLLLLSVMVWSLGDAWLLYAQDVYLPAFLTRFTSSSSSASSRDAIGMYMAKS